MFGISAIPPFWTKNCSWFQLLKILCQSNISVMSIPRTPNQSQSNHSNMSQHLNIHYFYQTIVFCKSQWNQSQHPRFLIYHLSLCLCLVENRIPKDPRLHQWEWTRVSIYVWGRSVFQAVVPMLQGTPEHFYGPGHIWGHSHWFVV